MIEYDCTLYLMTVLNVNFPIEVAKMFGLLL